MRDKYLDKIALDTALFAHVPAAPTASMPVRLFVTLPVSSSPSWTRAWECQSAGMAAIMDSTRARGRPCQLPGGSPPREGAARTPTPVRPPPGRMVIIRMSRSFARCGESSSGMIASTSSNRPSSGTAARTARSMASACSSSPVVDDVCQQVPASRLMWHRIGEEVAGHDSRSLGSARPLGGQLSAPAAPGRGSVKFGQDAAHARVRSQDGGDEPAVSRRLRLTTVPSLPKTTACASASATGA